MRHTTSFILATITMIMTQDARAGPGSAADFNGDGFVSGEDYDAFNAAFARGDPAADFNGDGFVSGDDFDAYAAEFQSSHTDDAGFKIFAPAPGAVVWYVDAQGDDTREGHSPATAIRTPSLALSRLRHGAGDCVMLEAGDRFGPLGRLKAGGGGPGAMTIIGVYGDGPRPVIACGPQDLGLEASGGSGTPADISHVAVVGLEFRNDGRTGREQTASVAFLRDGEDLWFSDCVFDGAKDLINLQGTTLVRDATFTRCIFRNAWQVPEFGHSQGLYAHRVGTLLVDECVFTRCGMTSYGGANGTIFSHATYPTSACGTVTFRRSLCFMGSAHGFTVPVSGQVRECLILDTPIGVMTRAHGSRVTDNVILGSRDVDPATPRGYGVHLIGSLDQTPGACALEGNIIAHRRSRGTNGAIVFNAQASGSPGIWTTSGNTVYAWDAPAVYVEGSMSPAGRVTSVGLTVLQTSAALGPLMVMEQTPPSGWFTGVGSTYFAQGGPVFSVAGRSTGIDGWSSAASDLGAAVRLPRLQDPSRDAGWYARSIGMDSAEEFVTATATRERGAWPVELAPDTARRAIAAGYTPLSGR